MDKVGIVGLGMIGTALVKRYIQCGVVPVVYDIKDQKVQAAEAEGAIPASSSSDLAAQCGIILLCVQTDDQCVRVVTGEGGLLTGAKPDTCIAVLATVLPKTVIAIAEQAKQHNVHVVDTPVAGRGQFSIEEGSMSALVGNDGELYRRLEPVLGIFASNIVPAGILGSGAALKLAHNIVVYAGFAAMIEAVDLARAAGVADGLIEEVTKASGAMSRLSALFIPNYQSRRNIHGKTDDDETLRVAAALVEKDLSDALEVARGHDVDLPIAKLISHFGARIFPVPGEDTDS